MQDEYTERDYEFAGLQRFGRASLVALAAASLCYAAPGPALAFRVSNKRTNEYVLWCDLRGWPTRAGSKSRLPSLGNQLPFLLCNIVRELKETSDVIVGGCSYRVVVHTDKRWHAGRTWREGTFMDWHLSNKTLRRYCFIIVDIAVDNVDLIFIYGQILLNSWWLTKWASYAFLCTVHTAAGEFQRGEAVRF